MKLRAFDIDMDFEVIRNWITDERTHAMWSANRIGFPMERKDFEDFLKRQKEEGDSAFAAENEDGRIVGFFLYGKNGETMEGMLKFIVIDPEQRGKGTAQEMLHLAAEYAFEKTGIAAVHLNVFSANPRAKRCYEKAGFRERNTTLGAFTYKEEKWDRINMILKTAGTIEWECVVNAFSPRCLLNKWSKVPFLPIYRWGRLFPCEAQNRV